MFSRADANALRESLGPFSPSLEAGRGASEPPLLSNYRAYYGLNIGGPRLRVSHHAGLVVSDDLQLVAQYFGLPLEQQRGTAIVLHGYFDHIGLYGHLIKNCLQKGLAVMSIDLPGHGLSGGEPASIDSFTRYSNALLALLEKADTRGVAHPWFAIGQSTGGAIWMDSILNQRLSESFAFRRFVLLAPLLRPWGWNRAGLLFHATRWFLSATPRRFSENSHDSEFLAFLRTQDELQSRQLPRDWVLAMLDYQRRFSVAAVNKVPLHIIQGTDDRTVDWQYNIATIAEKFPRSLSYLVTGAKHHLVNESEDYRSKVFGHVNHIIQEGLD